MTARLLAIGTAVPDHAIDQADAAALACTTCALSEAQSRLVPVLYRRSGIRRRASVLLANGLPGGAVTQDFFPDAAGATDRGPGTGARSERYALEAPVLAAGACRRALADARVDAPRVTHLITVSCTGFTAPGIDAALIGALGLSPDVQRTHIGFMGCHGAINGLRVARAFADADPDALILLCAVELCSLHFHYTSDAEKMVANALFADGAAAAVVAGAAHTAPSGPRLAACGSHLMPDSLDAMTWRIGDHGFEMTLSALVPTLIERHLAGWLTDWLAAQSLTPADVKSWAIHPGGPRVVSTVGESLRLSESILAASRAVLSEYGNMSSPTVLFILDRLLRAGAPLPCVAMAFGPGLVAEVALVR